MKTYIRYSDLPKNAGYLGSENGDGTIDEALANDIDDAVEPVQLIEPTDQIHYFDIGG